MMWGCVKQQSRCSTLLCHTERDQNGIIFVAKRFYSSQGRGGYPLERMTSWRFKLPCIPVDPVNDQDLSRSVLVRLWLADRKKTRLSAKRRHKVLKSNNSGETLGNGQTLPGLIERLLSSKSAVDQKSHGKLKPGLKQPPTSQSITGILEPLSLEEGATRGLPRGHPS